MIQIGIGFHGYRRRAATAPPAEPPVTSYYPEVPPVALGAAAGSLRLPEGNAGANAAKPGLEGYKGLLLQSKTGLTLAASTVAQATFAIVRLPREKRRRTTGAAGIFGNTGTGNVKWWLQYGYEGAAPNFTPGRFRFYQQGTFVTGKTQTAADLSSALWTEDEALVVAWTAGDGSWQLDWYSLKTGARNAGTAKAAVLNANTTVYSFNIGGTGTLSEWTANGDAALSAWPGDLQALGYVSGTNVDPAVWAQVALGARLRDVLPAAGLPFVREFDGTAASFARPAWATTDATAAATAVGSATVGVPASTLAPGTSFRRQSAAAHALIEMQSAGQVFGLLQGQAERSVPFGGRSSGPVELRVFEAETGRVVRDWTAMGGYANGAWGGAMTLPESTNGWLFADVRLAASPAVVGHWRQEFGVGWKVLVVGQSQTNMGLTAGTRGVAMTLPMSASYVDNVVTGSKASLGAAARHMTMERIGMSAASDGQVMFVNQFRKWKPKTPVMIYDEAVNGTSLATLMTDSYQTNGDRHYSDLSDKFAAYGNDISVVLFNWACNESIGLTDLPDYLDAWFFNTGPQAGAAFSMARDIAPGFKVAFLALDRGGDINASYNLRMRVRADYARAKGFALSPPVNDYRINNIDLAGHPQVDRLEGAARFMGRFAVGAARALGLDASQNPYFANARFSADRTKILIDAVAPNGGTIASARPNALRSWYVWETGDPAQTFWGDPSGGYDNIGLAVGSGRFTARLNGATVELTRTSGTWDPAAVVRYLDDNEGRAMGDRGAGDGAIEEAIHAGGLYESWPLDAMNGLLDGSAGLSGLPVVGSRENGVWISKFEAVPAAS